MITLCLILVALALGVATAGFAYVAHVLSVSVRVLSNDLSEIQSDLLDRIEATRETGSDLFNSVNDRINDAIDEVSETIREKTSEFTDAIDEVNDRISNAYAEGEAAILDLQASRDDVVNTVIPDLIQQGEAAVANARNESARLDREKLDVRRLENIVTPTVQRIADRLNVLETIAGVTGPEVVRNVLARVEALETVAAAAPTFVNDVQTAIDEIDEDITDLEDEGRAVIGDLVAKVDALTAKAAPKVRVRPSRAKTAKKTVKK